MNTDIPHINRLPNELLSAVFTSALPDIDAPLSSSPRAKAVEFQQFRNSARNACSLWKEVMKTTPECWRIVICDFKLLYLPDYHTHLKDQLMHRSGDTLLDVLLVDPDKLRGRAETLARIDNILRPSQHRWHRLAITGMARWLLVAWESWSMPALRHLRIGTSSRRSVTQLPTATIPKCFLNSLVLTDDLDVFNHPLINFSLRKLTLHELTHLRLMITTDITALLRTLQDCSGLEHLQLWALADSVRGFTPQKFDSLRNLRSLGLSYEMYTVIAPFEMPLLERLSLRIPVGALDCEWIGDYSLYPNLISLHISTPLIVRTLLKPFVRRHKGLREMVLLGAHLSEEAAYAAFLGSLDFSLQQQQHAEMAQLGRIHTDCNPDELKSPLASSLLQFVDAWPNLTLSLCSLDHSSWCVRFAGDHPGRVLLSRHAWDTLLVPRIWGSAYHTSCIRFP